MSFKNHDFDTIINLAALKDYKNSKDILNKNINIQRNILKIVLINQLDYLFIFQVFQFMEY